MVAQGTKLSEAVVVAVAVAVGATACVVIEEA